ncbi:helix-turn-helix transcriptional regulator [Paenibacillus sp. S25]|uniref:helix-turn-helix domain-containing protein n=1 Tax=Paenibacillus sp. S25 TaxID=2823905 RepID=UPI001C6517F8|nr:helix-turn-helix transcriptional regulator [Paenibacillus sp. S25]QYK62479.1 Helix-turn-helix domain protein [Paenibacillus sp. S25]
MNLKEFGIYFAKLRERSGYRSQRELAERSGVSHSTINRIESGSHKVSPENLKILAPFLKDVDYDDLMQAVGYIEVGQPRNNVDETIRLLEEEAQKVGLTLSDPKFIEMVKDSMEIIRVARGKDKN